MVIEYSGSTFEYTGPYSKKYRIDKSEIEKHKRDLVNKLGPNYENYYKLNFKLKSQKYVTYHITGRNEFTSRSTYGNKKYTAFTVNKDVDTLIQNYDPSLIERKKQKELEKEINHWNGRRYRYISPAGRNISRKIKTSRRDFNITLKSLLEVKSPQKIEVYSRLVPKKKKNIVNTSNRNKMCVKCGAIFNPIDWNGWMIKYLSMSDVYVCENCNKELKNSIVLEKLNRVEYETRTSNFKSKSKTLKKLLYVIVGLMIISPFLLVYILPLLIVFLLSLAGITTYLALKLNKLSEVLKEEKILENNRKTSVCNNIKRLDIKEELKENQQRQKINVVSKKTTKRETIRNTYIFRKINCEVCESELEILTSYSGTIYYCSHCDLNKCALVSCNKMCKSKFCSTECRKKAYKEPTIPRRILIKSTLKIKSYDFNHYSFESFTIYDSNNKILVVIPKERFNKEESNLYHCKCGKSYVSKSYFYDHLTNSSDCIKLFLTDERLKKMKISEENILKILNKKPKHFNDISLKFQIKDGIEKNDLQSKLKKLMREGKVYINVVGKDEYWREIPSTIPAESNNLVTLPKQKIEFLKVDSYQFNGSILTFYGSNNEKLATIPRERFNKKDSGQYHCMCGKFYLSSKRLINHLYISSDCINLFLLDEKEENILSRTIKPAPKATESEDLKDQERAKKKDLSRTKSYKFNDSTLTFYDSRNHILASIPQERFNKKGSRQYHCKCGKFYLNPSPFFKHLLRSKDCINLFLLDENEKNILSRTIKPALKATESEDIKVQERAQKKDFSRTKSYRFNNSNLTFYDSRNHILATIPRERFNKKGSSQYHCKCGKYYLAPSHFFKHLLRSKDCINLFMLTETEENISSSTIKTTPKIAKTKEQKKHQKIDPLQVEGYDFNGYILTFYDSNNRKLATIPRDLFNKINSRQYHCKCGKYYLGPGHLFKHLLRSKDCINLFMLTETEENISSRTVKTLPKITNTEEFREQEKTQVLEITDNNILRILDDKPISYKELSSKFIIYDAMDEKYLKNKLKFLVRKEYVSQEFVDSDLQFNWKLNPTYLRDKKKAEVIEKDSIAITFLQNYSYCPKTLICYKKSHTIVKKGIYNLIPELTQFLKRIDGDQKREFFQTSEYRWRRKFGILNIDSEERKKIFFSKLKEEVRVSATEEIDAIIDLNKNFIFYNEDDIILHQIMNNNWRVYQTKAMDKVSLREKVYFYLN